MYYIKISLKVCKKKQNYYYYYYYLTAFEYSVRLVEVMSKFIRGVCFFLLTRTILEL